MGIIFWKKGNVRSKDRQKEKSEEGNRWAHALDSLAAWSTLFSSSWLRCRRSSSPCLRLDLKTTIKIVSRRLSEESAAETQKPRNRDLELQIGGGKLRRGAAGVVSIFSNDFSTISMMKRGSSPPLDYGFVEVTYVSLLSLSFTN